MSQTTVVSLFQYKGFKKKWQALARMGRPPVIEKEINGLGFWKPFGTGKGFSIMPDFSTYSLFSVFDNENNAQNFIDSDIMKLYTDPSEAHSHVLMHNINSRGKWEKEQPFKKAEQKPYSEKIVVITRAQLKPIFIYAFWKKVHGIFKSMDEYPQLIYNKGVGELPFVMPVTFSIWENKEAMIDFSYKNFAHGQAAKEALENGFFKESLFATFYPIDIQGNLIENNPS